MSDDEGPIYAGFVTRATGLMIDEVVILVVEAIGLIDAGFILNAVIPSDVDVNLESILGAAA